MNILGISSFYHDSAAVLLKNGIVLAGAEEERFTRIKHDNSFPKNAIEFCMDAGKITVHQIDAIAYYEKPLLKFERILETFIATYPYSLTPFVKTIPEWLGQKITVEHVIRKNLKYTGKLFFVPHHVSHASAAFYSSRFDEAAIATIDGVGEYQTTGLWQGVNNTIVPLKKIDFPHSLGLLYSTFTAFLGFQVNNDEYKMMGLAAYGKPRYKKEIEKIIKITSDGSFKLNMDYFAFRQSSHMWKQPFENLFGNPRKPTDLFTHYHKDLAASVQSVTEDIYFRILNHLYALTKSPNLCIAGGVALNSLANGKIYHQTPFKNVSIMGPAGDSGAALGTALYVHHAILKQKNRKHITNLYWGSEYKQSSSSPRNRRSIRSWIPASSGMTFQQFTNEAKLLQTVAHLLSQNHVIGWFYRRMEFGPRALGARSILANPQEKWMKDRVNEVKGREEFRPFAASVLQDHVHELFEVPEKNHYSPFMNFCFPVKQKWRKKLGAITHADYTCRIQTVNEKDNQRYYRLINAFYKQTGIPCVLNTSFNLSHEPIVETPEQALADFQMTTLDCLVIENYIVRKS